MGVRGVITSYISIIYANEHAKLVFVVPSFQAKRRAKLQGGQKVDT